MPRLPLAVLAALLALPASASATTTVATKLDYFDKDQLIVKGDAAPSALTVSVVNPQSHDFTFTVSDAANPVTPGHGCAAVTPTSVTCHGIDAQFQGRLSGGDDQLAFTDSAAWEFVKVVGGDGADALDTSALTKVPRVTGIEAGIQFDAGKGDDTFQGGPVGEDVEGEGGDDAVHGGEGRDGISGGGGADQIFGDGGNDSMGGDSDDTAYDGGAGDDYLGGDGTWKMTCGDGDDLVGIDYEDPPGPVVPTDCETLDVTRDSPRPAAVTARTITFASPASADGYGRNTATMELTWKGKVVSSADFTARGRAVPVKLSLPRKLARAMRARPQVVGIRVKRFVWDPEGIGEYDRTQFTWRVAVDR